MIDRFEIYLTGKEFQVLLKKVLLKLAMLKDSPELAKAAGDAITAVAYLSANGKPIVIADETICQTLGEEYFAQLFAEHLRSEKDAGSSDASKIKEAVFSDVEETNPEQQDVLIGEIVDIDMDEVHEALKNGVDDRNGNVPIINLNPAHTSREPIHQPPQQRALPRVTVPAIPAPPVAAVEEHKKPKNPWVNEEALEEFGNYLKRCVPFGAR